MIRYVYSVRDEVSTLYMGLQLELNDAVACRNFDYALSRNEMMSYRPEDYSLWLLGSYDDTTGIITPCPPKIIKRGVLRRGKAVSRDPDPDTDPIDDYIV